MIDFLRDRFISVPPLASNAEQDSDVSVNALDQSALSTTKDELVDGTADDELLDSDVERGARGADGYYPVNEELAKAAQEANSFRGYSTGSATREYRTAVDSAREVATRQKEKVDARYHEKIDRILDSSEEFYWNQGT